MSTIHETTRRFSSRPLTQDLLADPADVLNHPTLTVDEKRQILSSWASDARAVESDPTLRQLPVGALVPIAEILTALRALPAEEAPAPQAAPRRKVPIFAGWHRRRKRDDGDWPRGGAPAPALHPAPGLSG